MRANSILTAFLRYVSLNVLGMIGLSCYILADTFFVARGLGANGLTALNLALPIYSFIYGTGLMIGMGGATKYTIMQSQGMAQEANAIFTKSVQFGLAASLVFVLIGILLADAIASLLGADSAVYEMTKTYLRILLLFAPMFILNNMLLCFVRNDGSPARSMLAMIIGSLSNVVLDYVFIFPLGMGIFGAALATGIAPLVSMLVLKLAALKTRYNFRLAKVRVDLKAMRMISALGLSALITELSTGVVMIAFNTIILSLEGNVGVAAYGVIANLAMVVISIFTGMAQGVQPLLSSNYGSGNRENVKKLYRYALVTATVFAGLIYLTAFLGKGPIVGAFNGEGNAALQGLAEHGMRLYFIGFIFVGINLISAAYFSAIEKPAPALVISLCRGFVLILPILFLLAALLEMTGVWLAFPVAEALTAALAWLIAGTGWEPRRGQVRRLLTDVPEECKAGGNAAGAADSESIDAAESSEAAETADNADNTDNPGGDDNADNADNPGGDGSSGSARGADKAESPACSEDEGTAECEEGVEAVESVDPLSSDGKSI